MNRSLMFSALALTAAGLLVAGGCNKKDKCCQETSAPPPAATTTAAATTPTTPLPPEPAPLKYESQITGSVTAQVVAVDVPRRHITLRGPMGYTETYLVGPQVQRFNEVSVGDNLTVSYTAKLMGELRAPTADEANRPIQYYTTQTRTGGSDPSGGEGVAVRVVTTVDAIDLSRMYVTLKGPHGNKMMVRAKSQENIRKLSVSDTIIVTYAEGMALTLDKN